MDGSKIRKFYENKNVFVTGGTGFMGKLLIEKLLRSTGVSTIYVLVRPKSGQQAQARLDDILSSEIFKSLGDRIRNRVNAVSGDVSLENLGLSSVDQQTLIEETNIVFHVAGNVLFNADIRTAFNINVIGTQKLIVLCKQMKNLQLILHVSTAFTNYQVGKQFLDEAVYECSPDYKELGNKLRMLSTTEVTKQISSVLKTWANTYSYTKTLAENFIKDNCQDLPIAIIRPSIVLSTVKEPLSFWMENGAGPTGIIFAASLGLLSVLPKGYNFNLDIVPGDMSVAAMIASVWDSFERYKLGSDIPIYNYTSSVENPIDVYEFFGINASQMTIHSPSKKALLSPSLSFVDNNIFYTLRLYLPSLCLDFLYLCTLKKPKFFRKVRAIKLYLIDACLFCGRLKRTYANENVKNMWNQMSPQDKEIFNFDVGRVNWLSYLRGYYQSIRQYLIKEVEDSTFSPKP